MLKICILQCIHQKGKSIENLIRSFFLYGCDDLFRGNMWGQSQQYTSDFDNDAIFICRTSLAWTIQHVFSNSQQNCSKTVSVDEIMESKSHTINGKRISRSGKIRWKQDFLPLYYSAAFFSISNLKTRLLCITQVLLLLCSRLQAAVRESP